MAKLDVSKIEGFAEMSAEEQVKALLNADVEDSDTVRKLKESVSNANSQAAEWKKKHNALLSDEERKKQEQEDNIKSLTDKIAELEQRDAERVKEIQVGKYKSQYLAMGYDDNLADATAKAMAGGDMATVFANQSVFNESREKALKAEMLKNTPTPPAGGALGGVDYSKEISEAMNRGDYATASYYTRMSQKKE